jgi:hypothetical protein
MDLHVITSRGSLLVLQVVDGKTIIPELEPHTLKDQNVQNDDRPQADGVRD